ncbi:AraC family transcriptional regulator [Bradyrhizobium sp. INPA01-394B]|uniref:AraC family transcriptional regulator n=1 Tax=Bradyrhizobium campsiandrae TaxID=1729892 RepID=A0ABR7UKQ2_9BRAD|nr:AraC family transcriptional regulator [Bradyrhizobium campsiandrae]MBC9883341.1 AraC family transcriptional regulator [Bradyrhizobium campsiandrae]MBC9983952.1 AraC family transcriptional regulator [Bradyrhizobium campsiandrae]
MEVDDHELVRLFVSSEPYAESGQLDAFREVWSRKMLRYELEPIDGHPLHFDAVIRSLPDLTMASGSRSPMRTRRANEHIDHDDFFLVVFTEGAGELNERGRVANIGAGEAVLSSNGSPASFVIPTSSRTISYRFSRALLRPHVRNLDDLVARPFAQDDQMLRLLVGYSKVLNDQDALATAGLRRAVSVHMHDLAALLLGGKAEPPLNQGLQAARLKAVKDEILLRLTDSDLSVDAIAGSQQVSERYMRKLFAAEGTTFTDFVREARLAHAHRRLTDPGQSHRPVQAIAYESGFGDLSYFNRTFRQRYGMTPSEARERARQDG